MNKVDVAFINGEVITIDDKHTIAEAVAVKGNKIIRVGTNDEIMSLVKAHTNIIDLEGKTLMPGFIDSHVHLTISGVNLLDLNCVTEQVKSINQLLKLIKEAVRSTEKGKWIRIWSFNEHEIDEGRFPSLKELDKLTPNNPLVIVRVCNHISMTNSYGLRLANITKESENPEGGIIDKDKTGNLTGKLYENAHMLLSNVFAHNEDELIDALSLASKYFIRHGITSVHDAGGYGSGTKILEIMEKSIQSDVLKIRVYAMIGSLTNSEDFIKDVLQSGRKTGSGNEWFKIGPAKVFIDGSSTGPTIATREGYTSDKSNKGILYYKQNQLTEILGNAHRHGLQVTAHAQGDQAVEMLINCIEEALKLIPKADHRHRIEHAGISQPDLQDRMRELGIIPIPNPAFMYINGDSYLENYGERVNHMYPVRDFINKGIVSPIASDAPVVNVNPFLGIHAAVNRLTKSGKEVGLNQRITVLEALESYTKHAAYASFDENIKGSIEVGKLADLIVLNRSILNTKKGKIKDLKVEVTMIDGKVVYKKNKKSNKKIQ